MGRLATKVLPPINTGETNTTITYTYTPAGQKAEMQTAVGGTTTRTTYFAYDNLNRLIRKDAPEGVLTYTWTPDSHVATINGYRRSVVGINSAITNGTMADVSLGYGYDYQGRLEMVTNNTLSTSNETDYSYDGVGNLSETQVVPDLADIDNTVMESSYDYNAQNRLTGMSMELAAECSYELSYGLDADGMRTNVSETLTENTSGDFKQTTHTAKYEYDKVYNGGSAPARVHRLTKETILDSVRQWNGSTMALVSTNWGMVTNVYDLNGNRSNRQVGFGTSPIDSITNQTFAFDRRDQIDTDGVVNNANTNYDKNGNTIVANGAFTGDLYDAENRLISRGSGIQLGYDEDGNRVSKTVSGTKTYYLVDDQNPTGYSQVLAEYSTLSSAPNVTYSYGLNLISESITGGSTLYYGQDGQGNVRFLKDASNETNVSDTYEYDGYGNLISATGSDFNNYRYASQQWDSDLGMYSLRARYYSSGLGRFWTMDTFQGRQTDPLSLHKYLYADDNPVNHRDPSGHDIEGSLDVMDMMSTGFGMQSPVIGSGRGTATAIALGTGGPEIKGILDRTLADVGTTFNTWTTRQKQAAAAMIGGGDTGIANSWDIAELHNVDPSLNTLYVGKGYSCGTGNCKATVAVNGSVYYADAANYALWGKMYQLVHDWYIKDWGGDTWYNPGRGFDLAAAQSFVKEWKLFRYGAITGEHRSEALMFTAYGYNGTLGASGLVGVAPSGQTVTEPLFTWRWMPNHP